MKSRKFPLIIFDNSAQKKGVHTPDFHKQNLLLKGMLMNAGDVKEAAKYAGIKTVASAYRTLDQLSLRKSFYDSLDNNDISLDFIVKGIKAIATEGDLDSVKLKAYQILLKTLGLENYSETNAEGKGWEETLMKVLKDKGDVPAIDVEGYDVKFPEIPQSEVEKRAKEDKIGKELYEQ